MKKVMTLALVALMIAMTCLPVFAAKTAILYCDGNCFTKTTHTYIGIVKYLDCITECPDHETHDAEKWYYHSDYKCNDCGTVQTITEVVYECLN